MSEILETIGRQRARITRMVEVFDTQLEGLRDSSRDPDYHLLREIARYFCHYPTSIHYPYEERLFARLAEVRPELEPQVADLKRKHERHARLVQDVFGLLDGACSGHMVPRERMLKEANAYVVLQREHMIPPATALFATATEVLNDADLATVQMACNAHADRQIRARIEDEFTRMEEAIEAETSAPA